MKELNRHVEKLAEITSRDCLYKTVDALNSAINYRNHAIEAVLKALERKEPAS